MNAIRFSAGVILSVASSVVVWAAVVNVHPIFTRLSASGLVPVIAGGVVGGFVAGLFAPNRKVFFSACVGFSFAGLLLGVMLWGNIQLGQRNPFYWFWPAWLAPAFLIGGFLSRRLWRVAV